MTSAIDKASHKCPAGFKNLNSNQFSAETKMKAKNTASIIESSIDDSKLYTFSFEKVNGKSKFVCAGTYKDCKDTLIEYYDSHNNVKYLVESSYNEAINYECM